MEANTCESIEITQHFDQKPYNAQVPVVVIRNAFKSFWQRNTENVVLNDLNLTVPKGRIYGLLGPSGCGKTTLLKCIIGRLSLDKGDVLTFGEKPGTPYSTIPGPRLGYMPQEDALDGIMSITEILYYYGCLLCVPKKRIMDKIRFLVNFLKLPSENKHFSSLSGGQKRRVSFAVALIHDAELLILDEPTVGVDQILKRNIWNYLKELVEDGNKTVIITTHYIEETRSANCVAMMFEGRFLAEAAPDHLLSHYHKNCLEDVFLCVYANQKKTVGHNMEEDAASLPLLASEELNEKNVPLRGTTSLNGISLPDTNHRNASKHNQIVRWSRLRAIVYRGYIQLLRYPWLLFLFVVSPMLMLWVGSFSFGRPLANVPIGVVNEDTGYSANKFLSCIDSNVILQNNFTCWEDAEKAFIDGKLHAVVKIGQNFTAALLDRFTKAPFVNYETILTSNINVSMDGTNFVFVETIRFTLLHAYKKFVPEFLMEHGMDKELVTLPIVVDNPVYGNTSNPYINYLMPAFITLCAVFYPMGLVVMVIFLDKDGGKLERLYTTGVTPFEVIIGCLINQLGIMVVELICIFFTVFVILGFSNEGSNILLLALCGLQSIFGTTLGLFIGASIEAYTSASVVAIIFVVSLLTTCGLFWSIEFMERAVSYICMVSPFALPVNAMRNIMFRSWTLLNPEVSIGFAVIFVWTVVLLTLSLVILRAKKST